MSEPAPGGPPPGGATTGGATTGGTTRRRVLAMTGVGLGTVLSGCSSDGPELTPTAEEGTVTVRLTNRDDLQREYQVEVRQGDGSRNEFSGVVPADHSRFVEMTATFPVGGDEYEFSIATDGAQRGGTWNPMECGDFLVSVVIRDGEPEVETDCRSA